MGKLTWSTPTLKELDVRKTESGPTYNISEDPFMSFYGPS